MTVSLPAAGTPKPLELESVRAIPGQRATETVLVVEDEEPVRRVVRRILELEGYRVLEAADGRAALAILDREPGPIDLLLSDIVMPEMHGRELAARVRERLPDCRVLLMSGHSDEMAFAGDQEVAASTFPFLQKPFTLDDVARKVREVLAPGP